MRAPFKVANRIFLERFGAGVYDFITGQEIWREVIARMPKRAGPGPASPRALDLGCGPGVSTFVLARCLPESPELVGVDLSPEMIRRARLHHARSHPALTQIRFEVGDASALPFEDGAFDRIFGHSFLYLLPDPVAVLREAGRLLAPGGAMVFMEPARSGTLPRAALSAIAGAPGGLGQFGLGRSGLGRFGLSMVLWRIASVQAGQLEEAQVEGWCREACLPAPRFFPVLGGLGMHVLVRG